MFTDSKLDFLLSINGNKYYIVPLLKKIVSLLNYFSVFEEIVNLIPCFLLFFTP